jgi:hypothetical protein
MEDRSRKIEESSDDLLQLVRHHVEEVLHEYFLKNGIKADYDVRDDAVLHVYNLARKKGTHDSKFQELRGQYIRVMVKSYLFSKNLDNQ